MITALLWYAIYFVIVLLGGMAAIPFLMWLDWRRAARESRAARTWKETAR